MKESKNISISRRHSLSRSEAGKRSQLHVLPDSLQPSKADRVSACTHSHCRDRSSGALKSHSATPRKHLLGSTSSSSLSQSLSLSLSLSSDASPPRDLIASPSATHLSDDLFKPASAKSVAMSLGNATPPAQSKSARLSIVLPPVPEVCPIFRVRQCAFATLLLQFSSG